VPFSVGFDPQALRNSIAATGSQMRIFMMSPPERS